jgi:hypothetical protein
MTPDSDVLAGLAGMPDELAAALARAGTRRRERPPEGGFSLLEHVWHLADLEREGFGARIALLRAGGAPFLPDFDGDRAARERDYQARRAEDGLALFRRAREDNLAALAACTRAEWTHEGTQEGVGRVMLSDLPRLMREHDQSHRAEIAALLRSRPAP